MTPNDPSHHDDLFAQAVEYFDRLPVPPRPADAEVLNSLPTTDDDQPPQLDAPVQRFRLRSMMMKRRNILVTAAGVVLAAVIGLNLFLPNRLNPNQAFAAMLDEVKLVHSMQCRGSVTGADLSSTMKIYAKDPGRLRQETMVKHTEQTIQMVMVMNFPEGKTLTLTPQGKQAVLIDMPKTPESFNQQNVVEQFRQLDEKNSRFVGEEKLDGRKTLVYEVTQMDMKGKLWLDPQSKLPVRMVWRMPSPLNDQEMEMTMDQFEWDVALDDALFSLEIPDGYQVRRMDMSSTVAADVVKFLHLWATLNDGAFPDKLDATSISQMSKVFVKFGATPPEELFAKVRELADILGVVLEAPLDDQPEQEQQMVKVMSVLGEVMGRGGVYIATLAQSKGQWHWVGKGVKLGEADKAIVYFKQKDDSQYTAIFGDLSTRQVDPKDLPPDIGPNDEP